MAYNILLTCPPMINQIPKLQDEINRFNFKIFIPDFDQTIPSQFLRRELRDKDAWIVGDDLVNEEILNWCREIGLKIITKWGVGTDNIDFAAAKRLKYDISNTPGVFAKDVAELALGFLINLCRNISTVNLNIHLGKWPKDVGRRIEELTIGIVGFGSIGKHLSLLLSEFDAKVIIYDPLVNEEDRMNLIFSNWPNDLNKIDYLIFCCPLNQLTNQMLNNSNLSQLKRGVGVINVSRGKVISEKTLIEGLRTGLISGAALDVFEVEPLPINSALRNFDNVILSSHNASNTNVGSYHTSIKVLNFLSEKLS